MSNKRKQAKSKAVGKRGVFPHSSSLWNSTSFSAVAVALLAVFCVLITSRMKDGNKQGQGATLSQLLPSELSEQELLRAWGVDPAKAQVDAVPISEMTHEFFREYFLLQRRPVVLKGAYASNPLVTESQGKWSFSSIRRRYGYVQLPSYMLPPQAGHNVACSDNGLCRHEETTSLGKILDETVLRAPSERKQRLAMGHSEPYPQDLNLKQLLPDMYQVYRKLSLFSENILLNSSPGGRDRWPSLFLGAAGTRTGLHVNSLGTSSTMAVFQGRKQFVLFPQSNLQHLCMDQPHPASKFGIDVFHPDFTKCPDAQKSLPMFATLEPGDILYIPGNTPHAARNLVDSIGIAQNFWTTEDYDAYIESGPVGYQARHERSRQAKVEEGIKLDPEVFARRDLFLLLEETGYMTDSKYWWSNNTPMYLEPDESERLAYERVHRHLESALETDPTLATRVAFLGSNALMTLALKAARIWDGCLDKEARDIAFVKPHGFPKDETRHRLRMTFEHSIQTGSSNSACQFLMKQFLEILEEGMSEAGQAMLTENTVSTRCSGVDTWAQQEQESWPQTRFLE